MALPSKETILAWRRFISSPPGREVLAYMRAHPPAVVIDPSVHVYAHSNGIRVGWQKAVDELEELEGDVPPPRVTHDRIGEV